MENWRPIWFKLQPINIGYVVFYEGNFIIVLSIKDITEETYISGGYIGLSISIPAPFIGLNSSVIGASFYSNEANDIYDYFYGSGSGLLYYTNTALEDTTLIPQTSPFISAINTYSSIDVNLSDMGGECGDGNVIGSYSGILYSINPDSMDGGNLNYDINIPVEFEVSFNIPRILYF